MSGVLESAYQLRKSGLAVQQLAISQGVLRQAAVIVLLLLTGASDGDKPPRAAHSSSQASTSGWL